MLTIFDGTPGMGKTAMIVSMMVDEAAQGRLIYAEGIRELQVPHQKVPPRESWTEWVDDDSAESGRSLQYSFPPGSLVVIDEAQRLFPRRASTARVPDYVAAMATHRHLGIDFWCVTQKATDLDDFIRGRCNRHIHLRKTWLGRQLLEWPRVGDPTSRTERDVSAKRSYKLPRRVFHMYKSAELHTKVRVRTPRYVVVGLLGVLALLVCVGAIYRTIAGKGEAAAPAAAESKGGDKAPAPVPAVAPGPIRISFEEYVGRAQPRAGGLPHTAPVYDHLTEAKVPPWPEACIEMGPKCHCYTREGVRLQTVEDTVCRSIVRNGYFTGQDGAPAGGGWRGARPGPTGHTPSLPSRAAAEHAQHVPEAHADRRGASSDPEPEGRAGSSPARSWAGTSAGGASPSAPGGGPQGAAAAPQAPTSRAAAR